MPKRKRDEDSNSRFSEIADYAVRTKASRFKSHFDNGVKSLTTQIKLARAFDRQKMSRRIKQAGSDATKMERLQAELEVLKTLDASTTAQNYLLKQCVRTKRIEESEAFVAVFGKDAAGKLKGVTRVAEGNVLGRLFKSNPVGEVLPRIMKGIREVLDVDGEVGARSGGTVSAKEPEAGVALQEASDEFAGFSDGSDQDAPSVNENEMSGGMDEETLRMYDSRLAASSDSDSEADLNGQNYDRHQYSMSITSDEDDGLDQSNDQDEDVSLPDESNTDDDQNTVRQPRSTSKSLNASSDVPITRTSFLPTLMHGGYYSGSESPSDPDDDPDADFAAAMKPRKNRRGQRERRAIAEKKFGSRAKHLVQENGAEGVHSARQALITRVNVKERDDGWDLRRGAVGDRHSAVRGHGAESGGKGVGRFERRNGARGSRSTGSNADPVNMNARRLGKKESGNENKPLHPSWEAAKKRKMESKSGVGSFAGTKITFD
ncbi:hypothetical protein H2198_009447 [Neophaeococcomyces mojaviensis]|uniref:Uncharacterized protein n=1 Tax=Neophaeococcomyces mojaviensis TaxID=3383035 RepID=A0ACC2ZUK8_9EURO|nr:hypothetical protein H2198_009447 [Knufia sp. JES_112]